MWAELNSSAYTEYLTAARALNKIYLKILKDAAHDKELQQMLRVTQKAFLALRKKEATVYNLKFKGASMLTYFKYRALQKMTEDRIKELTFYFKNYQP